MGNMNEFPPDTQLVGTAVELETPSLKALVTVHPWRQVGIRTKAKEINLTDM